jgi:hypothetical protein
MAESSGSEGQRHPKGIVGFMTTIPGVLTALAGVITAVTGLIIALNGGGPSTTQGAPPDQQTPTPTPFIGLPPQTGGNTQGAGVIIPVETVPTSPPPTPTPFVAPTTPPVQTVADISGVWTSDDDASYLFVQGQDPQYGYIEYNAFNVPTGEGAMTRIGDVYNLQGVDYATSIGYTAQLRLVADDELVGTVFALGASAPISYYR